MVRPSNQQAYTVANGTSKIGAPVQQNRDPTTLDVNYTLYDQWQNTSTGILFELASFTSTSGTVLANWVQFATNTNTVQTLTGDSGGAVGPTGSPGNINLLGAAGQIVVTGTPGTSTLSIALAGGGTAMDSFQPDSGTNPVVPTALGLVTMSGSGSITTVGGTNTLTTQLTGLTNHAVLVGAGTTTITKVGPSATTGAPLISGGAAADPGFSTTFTINDTSAIAQIVKSDAVNVVILNAQNTHTNNSALVSSIALDTGSGFFSSGVSSTTKYWNFGIVPSGSGTNPGGYNISYNTVGQSDPSVGSTWFRISTAGAITFANAFTFPTADGTAGQVLTTNGAGTVTWSSSGVGTWTDTSGVFTASRNSAYFLTAASTATLPASPAQGDTVDFVCDTTGSCVITGNTGQFIRIANQLSSAAGTATNSARGDTLSLVYRAATTTWFAFDAPNGGWTTA